MMRSSRYIGYEEAVHGNSGINGYLKCALVPLRVSLRSLLKEMGNLTDAIDSARRCCRQEGNHLDEDQASAIYLYTMEIPSENVYSAINHHLRTNNLVAATPWFPYIKLLHTALTNLPSYNGSVWRGVRGDVAKNYRKDSIICWWSFTSCTKSITAIKGFLPTTGKGTIFMIESRNGKAISEFSEHPDENEIILLPEINLKVVDEALNLGGMKVIHLQEVDKPVVTGKLNPGVHPASHSLPPALKKVGSHDKDSHHQKPGKFVTRFSLTRTFAPKASDSLKDKIENSGRVLAKTPIPKRISCYKGIYHESACTAKKRFDL